MDLLPAYRALIASPPQLALCGQAGTVAQLLQQLRGLWRLESVDDDRLVAELNRCSQHVLDLSARQMEGRWFPHRYHAGTRSLVWCLPQGHATEPFQDQYIDRCRQQSVFNQLIRPRTAIASLLSGTVADAAPTPAGFILHLSRCGSTLLSGCLAELDGTSVLSESPLLTEMLLDASLTDDQKQTLLPKLVQLQSAPFPDRGRIIVKWNAWDLFLWPLIRSAFPRVPSVLLFRDPEGILASHLRSVGRHMAGDSSLGHVSPALRSGAADTTVLDLRVRVLRGLLDAMSPLTAGADAMPVDYAQLDFATLWAICRHFALAPGAEELARIKQRMAFHSKALDRPFKADAASQAPCFDAQERLRIQRDLGQGYRKLLASTRPAGHLHE